MISEAEAKGVSSLNCRTGTLVIFSHSADHTTARYFELAARRESARSVVYSSDSRELSHLGPDDILFIVDPIETWLVGLENLPCLKVGYLIDTHTTYSLRSDLGSWCDLLFVAQRKYVQRLKDDGHQNVFWLPLGADIETHFVEGCDRVFDVGFVGKLGGYGSRRFKILHQVLPAFQTSEYWKWHHPSEMGRIYSQSKIVLNVCTNDDVTMRVFEALCSGAMLLSDHADGLEDLFVEGEHYVGFKSAEDAVEKIRYYLTNEDDRRRIAAAGHSALRKGHTYSHRLKKIEKVVSSRDWRGAALVRNYSTVQLAEAHARMFIALRSPFGVLQVIEKYGISISLMRQLMRAVGARINSKIPITMNAIRIRIRDIYSRWYVAFQRNEER